MSDDRQHIVVITTTGDRVRLSSATRERAKRRALQIMQFGVKSTRAGVLRLYPASSIRTIRIIPVAS